METAVCTGCLKEKHVTEFEWYAGKRRKRCRVCVAARRRAAYARNPEPTRERERSKYHKRGRAAKYGKARTTARLSLLIAGAKHRSKKAGLDCDLDWNRNRLEAVMREGRCELTGIAFDLEAVKAWNSPSLDRVAAGRGYTSDNTRIVLWAVNAGLGNWGEAVFAEVASAYLERRNAAA